MFTWDQVISFLYCLLGLKVVSSWKNIRHAAFTASVEVKFYEVPVHLLYMNVWKWTQIEQNELNVFILWHGNSNISVQLSDYRQWVMENTYMDKSDRSTLTLNPQYLNFTNYSAWNYDLYRTIHRCAPQIENIHK